MGGLVTANLFYDGRVPLKGAAFYFPVQSIRDQYAYNRDMAGSIRIAYGVASDGSDLAAKTLNHDPILHSTSVYRGKRLRFYADDADPVVETDLNAQAQSARLTGVATEAGYVEVNAGHSAGGSATVSDLKEFFARVFQ
jgi:hypothetical protein